MAVPYTRAAIVPFSEEHFENVSADRSLRHLWGISL